MHFSWSPNKKWAYFYQKVRKSPKYGEFSQVKFPVPHNPKIVDITLLHGTLQLRIFIGSPGRRCARVLKIEKKGNTLLLNVKIMYFSYLWAELKPGKNTHFYWPPNKKCTFVDFYWALGDLPGFEKLWEVFFRTRKIENAQYLWDTYPDLTNKKFTFVHFPKTVTSSRRKHLRN